MEYRKISRSELYFQRRREEASKLNIGKIIDNCTIIKHLRFEKVSTLKNGKEKKTSVYLFKCHCGNTFEKKLGIKQIYSCGCITKQLMSLPRPKNIKKDSSFNELYSSYKSRASYTLKLFTLTKEEFKKITSSNCIYCGINPIQKLNTKINNQSKNIYYYNGIDRKDSSKGYILDNCQPCCEICNKAKRDLPEDTFIIWLKRIANKWKE